jgi:hypothetical protein
MVEVREALELRLLSCEWGLPERLAAFEERPELLDRLEVLLVREAWEEA